MKLTQYNAISIDGYIAKPDGDSDWVSEIDNKYFEEEIKKAGCIIIGRRTYEQYLDELYPMEDVTNIVITRNNSAIEETDKVIISDESPEGILKIAEIKGHSSALLVGGGKANASFMEAGLIDEVILTVHPILLGTGIKLYETSKDIFKNLEYTTSKELGEGLIQLRYEVKK